MKVLGQRRLSVILRAAIRPAYYAAALKMFRGIEHPSRWFWRYLTGRGDYPASATVVTPGGPRTVRMWTRHDLLTVNEVFFRQDYRVGGNERVIVDFGSNIGISALYFLTNAPRAKLFLFEPVPFNVERLKIQLRGFEDRYVLHEVAVGTTDGEVSFGLEETGRYGGIGKPVGRQVSVPCRRAGTALAEIVAAQGRIDILKIDVEGYEQAIIESLPAELLERIDRIYAERRFGGNPLPRTHRWTQRGNMATFERRERMAA
jgi:FkbM family methyltransferase